MPVLSLKIDAPPNRIWAPALASALTDSLSLLDSIGRVVTQRGTRAAPPLLWYVDVKSETATANLIAEPASHDVDDEVVGIVGNGFVDGLRLVEEAEALPRFLSDTSLDKVNHLASKLGKHEARNLEATWTNGTVNAARVTAQASHNLKDLRKSRIISIGSVTGMLDALSLRNKPRFQVYEDVWQRPVMVHFDGAQIEAIKAGLGHRVVVSGTVFRNSKGQPVRLEDPTLQIMEEGPPLSQLVGIAPGYLGNSTLREYMESIG